MFKMKYKFPLRVLHGDFKHTHGHTLHVSKMSPDSKRTLRLEMRTQAGEVEIMKAADIQRVARTEPLTDSKRSAHLSSIGINKQRLPVAGGVFALAVALPIFPLTWKVIGAGIIATTLLIEAQVRVIINLMDGRYACVTMSERAFGMMYVLCNTRQ